jgi:hypothetical protein
MRGFQMTRMWPSIALTAALLASCEHPMPSTDCETGEDCVMILVGDPCSEASQCGCGEGRVAGNVRDLEQFEQRQTEAVCLPNPCLNGEAMCRLANGTLYCLDGECGVAVEEPVPQGADPGREIP